MMRFRAVLFALLLLPAAVAGAAAPPSPPAADAVPAAMAGFMAALNALDLEGMARFFAEDVTAFVPSAQAERAEGKAAVVEIFRRYVETTRASTPRTNLVPEDQRIDVRGETAVVSFHVRNAGTVARRTFVFRAEAGRWLISHFHASNLP